MNIHLKKKIKLKSILCIFSICFALYANAQLNIAAASSLRPVLDSIIHDFEKSNDCKVQVSYNSSGKICMQILNGVEYSLFLSADQYYVNQLLDKRIGLETSLYTNGDLCIWSKNQFFSNIEKQLKGAKTIALGNNMSPYGKVAKKYLMPFCNQDTSLQERFVYAPSVSQVNQYIKMELADMALTSCSAKFLPELESHGHWKTIEYDIQHFMIRLKEDELSKAFYAFVLNQQSKVHFKKYGFQ